MKLDFDLDSAISGWFCGLGIAYFEYILTAEYSPPPDNESSLSGENPMTIRRNDTRRGRCGVQVQSNVGWIFLPFFFVSVYLCCREIRFL